LGRYADAVGDEWVRSGVWRKPNATPQFTGDRPAIPGEGIAIMHGAGRKRWNGGGSHAYWHHNVARDRHGHPTAKPLPLMLELLQAFTDPGDLILDPFIGSGTTLRAAKELGRRAIGIEIEKRYCDYAVDRLRQEVMFQ
jgi:site-specific DNA-methyltransferase (adenine-specific)